MDRLNPDQFAEIKWADVTFLSLCFGGKNQFKGLYKSSNAKGSSSIKVAPLCKAQDDFDEKGQLAVVIYPANIADTDGEWASPGTVEMLAHGALKKGVSIDVHHDFNPLDSDEAYLAESWILKGEDPRFDGIEGPDGSMQSSDLVGSWVGIVQIDSQDLRKAYREEGWTGISMGGGEYFVKPGSAPPEKATLEKALSMDDVTNMFSRSIRTALRRQTGVMEPQSLRDLSMHVSIPKPGETDFDGNLREPTIHVNLSAALKQ